jgi:hypothetical protein
MATPRAARANVGRKRGQGRAICSVGECDRIVKGRHLCEMHYMRAYRHGGDVHAGEGRYGAGYEMTDGYILIGAVGHPLARAKGAVKVHRKVLYDAIGPGPHPCHWCGKPVDWTYGVTSDALVVDHLDDRRSNNDLDNLVPSCNTCNSSRSRKVAS